MTKVLRRTVAFDGPAEGTEQELHSDEVACVHVSTISEGVPPDIRRVDVHSPLPPPRASSPGAPRPIRTSSGDADLSALQRLFPEESEYRVAAPGRSLLWEGRCTCLCATTGAPALRPARPPPPSRKPAHSSPHMEDPALPDYHLLLFNDALVWARRSAGTISSPHRPLEFKVLSLAGSVCPPSLPLRPPPSFPPSPSEKPKTTQPTHRHTPSVSVALRARARASGRQLLTLCLSGAAHGQGPTGV